MKNNIYGRYILDLKWREILDNSQLDDEDYTIMKDKIYLYVPTDTKKLEDFIIRLFDVTDPG